MIKILFQYVGFYLSEEDEGHYTAWQQLLKYIAS